MERKELKKIPIDEAMEILHREGMKASREEAAKMLEFLMFLTELILFECFENE